MPNLFARLGLFLCAVMIAVRPAVAELCPEALQKQAEILANAQFDLAEVQNANASCGYQRFAIRKAEIDGETAYELSRLIYFVFNDERVLSDASDPAEAEREQASYFWNFDTNVHPVAVHNIDGILTIAPPTLADVENGAEFARLRALDPEGFAQVIQYYKAYAAQDGRNNFGYLNAAVQNFIGRHWHLQNSEIAAEDCSNA